MSFFIQATYNTSTIYLTVQLMFDYDSKLPTKYIKNWNNVQHNKPKIININKILQNITFIEYDKVYI